MRRSRSRLAAACAWPSALRGQYFFADNVTGKLSALKLNATRDGVAGANPRTIIGRFRMPVSLRLGPEGDLYVVDLIDAAVYRVTPKTPGNCDAGTR